MGPRASVVVPTYDRAGVLERCIDSVLAQTLEDFELVVVDDGSHDRTERLVTGYDDERVRYLYQENRGANAARMTGVRAATGRYVSFLDSDDRLHRTHLARAVAAMEAEGPRCAGVATAYQELAADGRLAYVNRTPAGRIGFAEIVAGNPIGSFTATTFRADVIDAVGGLDERIPAAQDYEFYLRVLQEGYYIRGIADVLADRFEAPGRLSDDLERRERAFAYLVDKHGETLADSRLADHRYMLGFMRAEAGDLRGAAAEFRAAIAHDPSNLLFYYHYLSALAGGVGWAVSLAVKRAINRRLFRPRRGVS